MFVLQILLIDGKKGFILDPFVKPSLKHDVSNDALLPLLLQSELLIRLTEIPG